MFKCQSDFSTLRALKTDTNWPSNLTRRHLCATGLALATIMLVSCAGFDLSKYEVEKQTVQSFEAPTGRMRKDQAFAEITNILVNRGFDLKMSNRESGLITTEFKKYGSFGDSPPFDYYLQLRVQVRDVSGKSFIRMSPIVKEQNRLNAAAFTEHELYYFDGPPEGVRAADRGGAVSKGQTAFINVVTDVSERAGVRMEDVTKNVTTTKFNALLGSPRK